MKNIPKKQKLLMELIIDYSKVTSDKVNLGKFLSTVNEQLELKIQENISTKNKGMHQQNIQDLYEWNYKTDERKI